MFLAEKHSRQRPSSPLEELLSAPLFLTSIFSWGHCIHAMHCFRCCVPWFFVFEIQINAAVCVWPRIQALGLVSQVLCNKLIRVWYAPITNWYAFGTHQYACGTHTIRNGTHLILARVSSTHSAYQVLNHNFDQYVLLCFTNDLNSIYGSIIILYRIF